MLVKQYFFVFVSETQLIVYTAFTYIFLIILIIIIVTLTCLYCVKKRRDSGRTNRKKAADDTRIKFPSTQDYPNGVDDDVFTIDPRQMNGQSIPGKGSSFRPPPESTLR